MADELLLDTGAFVALVDRSEAAHDKCVEKYRNAPMDFADATLVALAEELETQWIFTLDRRGFSTYRLGRRKAFQIIP